MTKQERTEKIIKKYRGLPGEFYMLKGLLCMDHAFDCMSEEFDNMNELLDGIMIAKRMDELNA